MDSHNCKTLTGEGLQALISIRTVGGKKLSRRFLSHDIIQVCRGVYVQVLLKETDLFLFLFISFHFCSIFVLFFSPRHCTILSIRRLRVLSLNLIFFFLTFLVVNTMITNSLWRFLYFFFFFFFFLAILTQNSLQDFAPMLFWKCVANKFIVNRKEMNLS